MAFHSHAARAARVSQLCIQSSATFKAFTARAMAERDAWSWVDMD